MPETPVSVACSADLIAFGRGWDVGRADVRALLGGYCTTRGGASRCSASDRAGPGAEHDIAQMCCANARARHAQPELTLIVRLA